MKITKDLITVLSNFSTINQNMFAEADKPFATINNANSVYAQATSDEFAFPSDVGVYNLSEFLQSIGLVPDAELQFTDKTVIISNKNVKFSYRLADKDILTTPKKAVNFKDSPTDVNLDISQEVLTQLSRAASTLGASHVSIESKKGSSEVVAKVFDPKKYTLDVYTYTISESEDSDKEYEFLFLFKNFLFLPGDYKLTITPAASRWVGKNVTYYVAIEQPIK